MKLLTALGLVLLLLLTAVRLPAWSSNTTLWGAAISVSPDLPRPVLNYGIARLKAGDHQAAALFLLHAAELAERRQGPRDGEVLILVSRGFTWIEAFGTPICTRPSYQRFC